MAETLATHDNVEAVKYDKTGAHHLYEVDPQTGKKKHISSDEYQRQWGYDPSVRTGDSPQPIPIPVVEAPAESSEAVLPAVAEGNASAKAIADEMNGQVDEVNNRLDEIIPPNQEPAIPDTERKFQNEQKVKVVKSGEDGDKSEEGWEIVGAKGRNAHGEIIYVVKNPDGAETREVSESLLENMQLAPEGEINSIENQFARLEERLNKRLEEGLARIEARLGTEAATAIRRPEGKDQEVGAAQKSSDDEVKTMGGWPFGNWAEKENGKTQGPEGPVEVRWEDDKGNPVQLRRTAEGQWQINKNGESDPEWFDLNDEQVRGLLGLGGAAPVAGESPPEKKLKIWTLKEDKEDGEELEIQEGDTAVIKMPDGSFNKEGKIKDIVEEDGKRYVIIAMSDGTERKIDEADYLKGHIESGEFDEVEEEEKDETAVIEEPGGDEELGPPQTGIKARWNQLKNWLKGKRGKARDAAVAAQVKAINKANGIEEPPDEGLTKEQKEKKHKCRRLAFFLGGAALAGGGVVLAWYLTSRYGVNPFDSNPSGPESVPPPTPKNVPGPDQVGGWHTESLEPYNPGGGSYNHYDAGTIWDHTIDDLQKQMDQRPTDAQIQRATQLVLDHNNLTWDQAKSLPVGFEFRVPGRFPDWVINGR